MLKESNNGQVNADVLEKVRNDALEEAGNAVLALWNRYELRRACFGTQAFTEILRRYPMTEIIRRINAYKSMRGPKHPGAARMGDEVIVRTGKYPGQHGYIKGIRIAAGNVPYMEYLIDGEESEEWHAADGFVLTGTHSDMYWERN